MASLGRIRDFLEFLQLLPSCQIPAGCEMDGSDASTNLGKQWVWIPPALSDLVLYTGGRLVAVDWLISQNTHKLHTISAYTYIEAIHKRANACWLTTHGDKHTHGDCRPCSTYHLHVGKRCRDETQCSAVSSHHLTATICHDFSTGRARKCKSHLQQLGLLIQMKWHIASDNRC